MTTSTGPDTDFRNDAGKYAAYLETREGRLRLDLAFANLQEFLPVRQSHHSLCALDLGCGTGATAVRMARLGVHVTMLDSSLAMLEIANHSANEAAVNDQVTLKQGDATELSSLLNAGSFDVILCHNLLEYVDDPGAVLRGAARLMRWPAAILFVLVRQQAGEVLKTAIQRAIWLPRKRSSRGVGRGIAVRRQSALVHLKFSRSDVKKGVAHYDRPAWSAHCC